MSSASSRTPAEKPKSLTGLITGIVTVCILILALFLGRSDRRDNDRPTSEKQQSNGPEECIQRMLVAAQAGNVENYLDCFAGELNHTLSSDVTKEKLRRRENNLENMVTRDVRYKTKTEATLELVRTYADRNLRHRVRLQLFGKNWKITEMVPVEQYQPEIPFGTPVVPGLKGQPVK